MATIVWRVTPTFSASAAWVISPAWKRRVRIVLLICGLPLPMGLADPVVDEAGDGIGDAGEHEHAEEEIGRAGRIGADGEVDERREAAGRGEEIGVAHAAGVDRLVALVGALVLQLLAPGDADGD